MADNVLSVRIDADDQLSPALAALSEKVGTLANAMAQAFGPALQTITEAATSLGVLGDASKTAADTISSATSGAVNDLKTNVEGTASAVSTSLGDVSNTAAQAGSTIAQAGQEGAAGMNAVAGGAGNAGDGLKTVGGEAEDAGGKLKKAGDDGRISFTELNQALELAKKGLNIIEGAISAVVNTSLGLVRAFGQDQDAAIMFTNALKSQGPISQELIGQYRQFGVEVGNQFRFVQGEVDAMGARLISFGSVSRENIGIAMIAVTQFARATKTDLESAAALFGRAFAEIQAQTGPVEIALGRTGIKFKSTGDQAKDFATLISLVQQRFSAAANEMANGANAKLSFIAGRWEDLKSALGEKLFDSEATAGLFKTVENAITDLIGRVQALKAEDINSWVSQAISLFNALIPAATILATAFIKLTEAVSQFLAEVQQGFPSLTNIPEKLHIELLYNQMATLDKSAATFRHALNEATADLEDAKSLIEKTRAAGGIVSDEQLALLAQAQQGVTRYTADLAGVEAQSKKTQAEIDKLKGTLAKEPNIDLGSVTNALQEAAKNVEGILSGINKEELGPNLSGFDTQREIKIPVVPQVDQGAADGIQTKLRDLMPPEGIPVPIALRLMDLGSGAASASIAELNARIGELSSGSVEEAQRQLDALRQTILAAGKEELPDLIKREQELLGVIRDFKTANDATQALRDQTAAIQDLNTKFALGTISARDYDTQLAALTGTTAELKQLEAQGLGETDRAWELRARAAEEYGQKLRQDREEAIRFREAVKQMNIQAAAPFRNDTSQFLSDFLKGEKRFGDAFRDLGRHMRDSFVESFSDSLTDQLFKGVGFDKLAGAIFGTGVQGPEGGITKGTLGAVPSLFGGIFGGDKATEAGPADEAMKAAADAAKATADSANAATGAAKATTEAASAAADTAGKAAEVTQNVSQTTIVLSLLTPIGTTQTTITTAALVPIVTAATVVTTGVVNMASLVTAIAVANVAGAIGAVIVAIGFFLTPVAEISAFIAGIALSLYTLVVAVGAVVNSQLAIVEAKTALVASVVGVLLVKEADIHIGASVLVVPYATVVLDSGELIVGIVNALLMTRSTVDNMRVGLAIAGLIEANEISGSVDMKAALINIMSIDNAKFTGPSFGMGGGDGGGGIVGKVRRLLGFASGGEFSKPTIALFGEGGESEFALPESRLMRLLKIAVDSRAATTRSKGIPDIRLQVSAPGFNVVAPRVPVASSITAPPAASRLPDADIIKAARQGKASGPSVTINNHFSVDPRAFKDVVEAKKLIDQFSDQIGNVTDRKLGTAAIRRSRATGVVTDPSTQLWLRKRRKGS